MSGCGVQMCTHRPSLPCATAGLRRRRLGGGRTRTLLIARCGGGCCLGDEACRQLSWLQAVGGASCTRAAPRVCECSMWGQRCSDRHTTALCARGRMRALCECGLQNVEVPAGGRSKLVGPETTMTLVGRRMHVQHVCCHVSDACCARGLPGVNADRGCETRSWVAG